MKCPVCWQHAPVLPWGTVMRHMDSIRRDVCPMSGHPLPEDLDRLLEAA